MIELQRHYYKSDVGNNKGQCGWFSCLSNDLLGKDKNYKEILFHGRNALKENTVIHIHRKLAGVFSNCKTNK